jgi:hypothetical protein
MVVHHRPLGHDMSVWTDEHGTIYGENIGGPAKALSAHRPDCQGIGAVWDGRAACSCGWFYWEPLDYVIADLSRGDEPMLHEQCPFSVAPPGVTHWHSSQVVPCELPRGHEGGCWSHVWETR